MGRVFITDTIGIYPGTPSIPTRDGNAEMIWLNLFSLEMGRPRNQEGGAQEMGEIVGPVLSAS